MKFYITIEDIDKLKKSFLNLKLFSVIYIPEILEQYGYTYSTIDEYGSFIVSKYINNLIKIHSKSKRIIGIFYSNPEINKETLDNLFETLKDIENINKIVLIDDYNVPKLEHLYKYFEEVVFFPSIKKIRLIECRSIQKLNK